MTDGARYCADPKRHDREPKPGGAVSIDPGIEAKPPSVDKEAPP